MGHEAKPIIAALSEWHGTVIIVELYGGSSRIVIDFFRLMCGMSVSRRLLGLPVSLTPPIACAQH